jgi:hypothetical protein
MSQLLRARISLLGNNRGMTTRQLAFGIEKAPWVRDNLREKRG